MININTAVSVGNGADETGRILYSEVSMRMVRDVRNRWRALCVFGVKETAQMKAGWVLAGDDDEEK